MRCLVLVAAALAVASAAGAHPLPRAAEPAPNAVLSASPPVIRITFSEGLVPAFSGLALQDQAGHAASLGPATFDPNSKTTMSAAVLSKLAPGTYTVTWHAVGDDTHHVAGHYSFQVRP